MPLKFNEFVNQQKESMNKKEIMAHWTGLPMTPIAVTPEPKDHYGTSMDEDTLRITGSKEFIDSILVRLKDILQHENPETELDVKYQVSEYEHAGSSMPNYKFYCSIKYRNSAKKIPKGAIKRGGF